MILAVFCRKNDFQKQKRLEMVFFKPFFVVPTGVEPATPSLGNLCSIQLNYGTEKNLMNHICRVQEHTPSGDAKRLGAKEKGRNNALYLAHGNWLLSCGNTPLNHFF